MSNQLFTSVFNLVAKVFTSSHDPPAPFAPEVKEKVREIQAKASRPVHDANTPELSDAALGIHSTCYYFAFGSNMNPAVFEKRRKMDPLQRYPAVVKGYRLAFNLPGFPPLEPTFGNLKACEHDVDDCAECEVHGVVFRISRASLDHLHLTEGGPGNYDLVSIQASPYLERALNKSDSSSDSEVLTAYTLIAPPGRTLEPHFEKQFPPSERYLNLLRAGAREHGLDPEWIAMLDSHPTSKFSAAVKAASLAFFAIVFLPLFTVVFSVAWILRVMGYKESSKHFRTRSLRYIRRFVWAFLRSVA